MHLHYRANLSQSTGEDWNDAQLTLSTRAPEDLDGGIPQADTVQIRGEGQLRYVPSFFSSLCTSYRCRAAARLRRFSQAGRGQELYIDVRPHLESSV